MNFSPGVFHLLIAPPAWGKTRLFREWSTAHPSQYLFISPLRALATEVKALCPGVWVVLPEEILALDWEALAQKKPDLIVVWDEVHLVPAWGESFRHALLEAWYGFCLSGLAGVGLSATVTQELRHFLCETLQESHRAMIEGDAGNFSFKHTPTRYICGPRAWLEEAMVEQRGRTLLFCSRRHEVERWCQLLRERNIIAWGCRGGETKEFSERLKAEAPPEWIVATSCLSHGVNLPALSRVIILDEGASEWMRHQMCTRAGRRGEAYEIWLPWSVPLSWRLRARALLRAVLLVMMGRLSKTMRAWWHGNGRFSHSNIGAKRARPHRSDAFARRHPGQSLRVRWHGRR